MVSTEVVRSRLLQLKYNLNYNLNYLLTYLATALSGRSHNVGTRSTPFLVYLSTVGQ